MQIKKISLLLIAFFTLIVGTGFIKNKKLLTKHTDKWSGEIHFTEQRTGPA